jgi:hypothetical protein
MKKYQAPQIEVTVFEVEDIVTANGFSFSSFSFDNFGGWDYGNVVETPLNSGSSNVSD